MGRRDTLSPLFPYTTLFRSLPLSSSLAGAGTITIPVGQPLALTADTVANGLTVAGSPIASGNTTLNGAITSAAGSLVQIRGDGEVGGTASLPSAQAWMNHCP